VGHHAKVDPAVQREVMQFLRAVAHAIERFSMLARQDRVMVALSGGPDSVATLAALVELAPRLGIAVSAAHVHHGLRGAEADRDAALAQSVAERLGVTFRLLRLPSGLARGGNLEERARQARYAQLVAVAGEMQANRIATGHTCDDQAETVLMRLVRGCGPDGLVGILPVRDGGLIVRPLLECTRAEVERFLAARGLPSCADSSNVDRRFLRNRIRHDVLPLLRELNPQIDRRLADLAKLTRQARAEPQPVTKQLSIADLGALPDGARSDLARRWLIAVRGDARRLTQRHVTAVVGLLRPGRPNRCIQVPGGTVLREYDRLRFESAAESEAVVGRQSLPPGAAVDLSDWRIEASPVQPIGAAGKLPGDLWSAALDADAIQTPLTVRAASPGDRVRPLGMRGRRKLSDIFIDRRVPRAIRSSCPVVTAGTEIVWVPGVVRAGIGQVRPATRRLLWLRAESRLQPLLG
jgi:tRNA(Ile)-lysidine synthase